MCFFFFNDTATTEIYTLSLHDALPISAGRSAGRGRPGAAAGFPSSGCCPRAPGSSAPNAPAWRTGRNAARYRPRSEEHTSELQSRQYLVCRLLLEKKKKITVLCDCGAL